MSESESANSKSIASIGSCKMKGVKVVPLEESCIIEEAEGNSVEDVPAQEEDFEHNVLERYDEFLMILDKEEDLRKKCKVVEQIRHLLKDDDEARIYMGANGFVEVLLRFLECAVQRRHEMAQEIGAMALFNLAVNNNRFVSHSMNGKYCVYCLGIITNGRVEFTVWMDSKTHWWLLAIWNNKGN